MSAHLQFADITKRYTSEAGDLNVLLDISGSVAQGEWLGISGPSGSGKTSLLHILGAVDEPTTGTVYLHSEKIPFEDKAACDLLRRSKIGFVFQYFRLLRHLTAQENVMVPLLLNGRSHRAAKNEAAAALQNIGLEHRMNHLPTALSGGEQQRVAIARASVHRPEIIIADEPTGNLDEKNRDAVLSLFERLRRDGIAIIMASHSAVALKACTRVCNLVGGHLTE